MMTNTLWIWLSLKAPICVAVSYWRSVSLTMVLTKTYFYRHTNLVSTKYFFKEPDSIALRRFIDKFHEPGTVFNEVRNGDRIRLTISCYVVQIGMGRRSDL